MINRIVVGAGYGLKDWIAQRATALVMAVYTLILLVVLGALSPSSYEAWRAIFANGFMQFMTFLFFVSLFYHVWIGVRDIWMDYVKSVGVRLLMQVLTILWLVGSVVYFAQILWSI